MLYVIPFVILLIVAVVLKKWEMSKAERASVNKANTTRKGKKVTQRRTNNPHAETYKLSPTTLAEPPKTTPISQELHQKIISLMQAENYVAAEAQINQSLNHDNSQHSLFLYLLDIHILQKDDLAIDQLIAHLRLLNLQDIIMRAEAKNREYKQKNQTPSIELSSTSNSLTFQSDQLEQEISAPHHITISHADFDLFAHSAKKENSGTATVVSDPPEINTENSVQIEVQASTSSFSQPAKEVVQIPRTAAMLSEQQASLSHFSFTLEPREVSNHHIETAKNIDLDISQTPLTQTPSLKVSLDLASQPPLASNNEHPENQTDTIASILPEFKFEQPIEQKSTDPIEAVVELALTLDQTKQPNSDAICQTCSVDLKDPLVQFFPELAQINELQLDLDLSIQYIELGAYDSARILLTKNEALFSEEQREISKNLLNRIAS